MVLIMMIMMMMMIMMPMIITQTKVGDAGMRAADAGNLCAGILLVGFPNLYSVGRSILGQLL